MIRSLILIFHIIEDSVGDKTFVTRSEIIVIRCSIEFPNSAVPHSQNTTEQKISFCLLKTSVLVSKKTSPVIARNKYKYIYFRMKGK